MEEEHKQEIIRELLQEQREEGMYIWIEDNKDQLRKDYISDHEDEFDSYCREEYYTNVAQFE